MLQIENEYYSSVRPKQVPEANEKPSLALLRRGVRYVELRSLDINIFDPVGISNTQCRFMETLMAFCLMQDSPVISETARKEIDHNLDAVCYRGREPGLTLQRDGKTVTLRDWASELCNAMTGFAEVLDGDIAEKPYRQALQQQVKATLDPEKTLSARVLEEMRSHGEGYFHFAKRMSLQHQKYYLDLPENNETFSALSETVEKSLTDQHAMEDADEISFDAYLENYFSQKS